eukprot:CAMPEP_0113948400 /NCGR_PEP_ID=MMETSP1339-20121228/70108_1 /TAXON_ID=94617 /ORGANISM="Fibrocapsa japonica" /LENGTH=233 /DNA_ID=CAMNT_0000955449 /DNA_START=39 /DNA_END=740 /DNA_ORIENTATION=- /assembly_acc=CAM_ASM_000762
MKFAWKALLLLFGLFVLSLSQQEPKEGHHETQQPAPNQEHHHHYHQRPAEKPANPMYHGDFYDPAFDEYPPHAGAYGTSSAGRHTKRESSWWPLAIKILFPVPLFLMVLLVLPLPQFARQPLRDGVVTCLDKTLFVKMVKEWSLFHFVIFCSGAVLVACIMGTQNLLIRERNAPTRPEQLRLRMSRWRSERNFWIISFAFCLWVMVYNLVKLMKENRTLRQTARQTEEEKKEQ